MKKTIIILILLLSLTGCINNKKITHEIDKNFKYVGIMKENKINDNYIFTSYTDYKEKINSDILSENDFINNNYLLVNITFNECGESDIKPTKYNIKDDKINITVEYKASCGVCAPQHIYYLLKLDKKITDAKVNMKYVQTNNDLQCNPNVAYKPIIYLYPTTKTNITVKLENNDKLITSYPKYNNSWNITADTTGILTDENGRQYYGLYWEGNNKKASIKEDGFIVEGDNIISFLENKLKILGLTDKEANEFIIYWLPKLEKNKYNYIRFETMDEINEYMPLTIEPKPDTIIRIMMDFKPLDKPIELKEQLLNTPNRNGFTIVEWGGTIIE